MGMVARDGYTARSGRRGRLACFPTQGCDAALVVSAVLFMLPAIADIVEPFVSKGLKVLQFVVRTVLSAELRRVLLHRYLRRQTVRWRFRKLPERSAYRGVYLLAIADSAG